MKIIKMITSLGEKLSDTALLLLRLILAYGFFEPAKNKILYTENIAGWFESLGYPLPALNAYLAAATEGLGVILLALGLFTRFISIPLMFVMVIAITTVHWSNGFSAGDNGIEIPLYYMLMLLVLFAKGSGKYSIDRIFELKMEKKNVTE